MDEMTYSPIELDILDTAAEDIEDTMDDMFDPTSDSDAIDAVAGDEDLGCCVDSTDDELDPEFDNSNDFDDSDYQDDIEPED